MFVVIVTPEKSSAPVWTNCVRWPLIGMSKPLPGCDGSQGTSTLMGVFVDVVSYGFA